MTAATVTDIKPAPVYVRDTSWTDSDDVFALFMASFTPKDAQKLREREGRVRPLDKPVPSEPAVFALRDLIRNPTGTAWRAIRAYRDQDLAAAMRTINELENIRNSHKIARN